MNAIALNISNISVRQDSEGRYSLNDLHKASGNASKNKPSEYLRNQQAKDLISEIELEAGITAIKIIKGRGLTGTYACKELVYAYAMWISPAFTLKVIHAYDALVAQQSNIPLQLPEPKTKKALPGGLTLEMQDTIKALVKERVIDLPKDKQAGAIIRQWSAIKKKFGCSYKEVSPDNYVNILSLLSRLPLEGELLPMQEHQPQTNSITLMLGENSKPKRYLITQGESDLTIIRALPDNTFVGTSKQVIIDLQADGYIVMKKAEMIDRLTAS